MITVWNTNTGATQEFSALQHDAVSAVAYCYCEEQGTLPEFFRCFHSWKMEELIRKLPLVYWPHKVVCGRWEARV